MNGVKDAGEDCDDNNAVTGDGCDITCTIEPDSYCDASFTTCAVCGNGNKSPPETCDDSNLGGGDGCSSIC